MVEPGVLGPPGTPMVAPPEASSIPEDAEGRPTEPPEAQIGPKRYQKAVKRGSPNQDFHVSDWRHVAMWKLISRAGQSSIFQVWAPLKTRFFLTISLQNGTPEDCFKLPHWAPLESRGKGPRGTMGPTRVPQGGPLVPQEVPKK